MRLKFTMKTYLYIGYDNSDYARVPHVDFYALGSHSERDELSDQRSLFPKAVMSMKYLVNWILQRNSVTKST